MYRKMVAILLPCLLAFLVTRGRADDPCSAAGELSCGGGGELRVCLASGSFKNIGVSCDQAAPASATAEPDCSGLGGQLVCSVDCTVPGVCLTVGTWIPLQSCSEGTICVNGECVDAEGITCGAKERLICSREGVYPSTDCTKFYDCSSRTPIIKECPDNYEYNPCSQTCDIPHVDSTCLLSVPTCEEENILMGVKWNPSLYYTCSNMNESIADITWGRCDDGIFDESKGQCDDSGSICAGVGQNWESTTTCISTDNTSTETERTPSYTDETSTIDALGTTTTLEEFTTPQESTTAIPDDSTTDGLGTTSLPIITTGSTDPSYTDFPSSTPDEWITTETTLFQTTTSADNDVTDPSQSTISTDTTPNEWTNTGTEATTGITDPLTSTSFTDTTLDEWTSFTTESTFPQTTEDDTTALTSETSSNTTPDDSTTGSETEPGVTSITTTSPGDKTSDQTTTDVPTVTETTLTESTTVLNTNVPSTSETETTTSGGISCERAGLFPIPSTTCSFLECFENGSYKVWDCANGYHFDSNAGRCLLGACSNSSTTTSTTEITTTPDSPTSPGSGTCTSSGLFAIPSTTCAFLQCFPNGTSRVVYCTNGFHFDINAKRCILGTCSNSSVTSTEFTTDSPTTPPISYTCTSSGLFSIPSTTCSFLQCYSDGTYTVLYCSNGYHFDSNAKRCVLGACSSTKTNSFYVFNE